MGIFDGQGLDKLTYDPLNVDGDAFDLSLFDFRPAAPDFTIYYKDTTGWAGLLAGVSGQFLQTQGGGGPPQWVSVPGGGDMLAGTYDPTGVIGDAFDLAKMAIPGETKGDIYIFSGTTWARLALGTALEVLTAQGTGLPAWSTVQGNMLVSVFDPTGIGASAFDLSNFLIAGETQGDLYTFNGVTWRRLAIGPEGQVLTSGGGGADPRWAPAALGRNEISDLTVTFLTTDTVQIEIGECRTDDNANDIRHTAPLTVDITASGLNGLDTGAEAASTWYDLYILGDASGNTRGILVLQGNTPINLGAFTRKRRIGIVRNDASLDFVEFTQGGVERARTYFWLASTSVTTLLSGGSATTPTAVALGALVPPSSQSVFLGVLQSGGTEVDIHQLVAGPPLYTIDDDVVFFIPTDPSQQVAYSNAGGGGNVDLLVHGFSEEI